MRKQTVEPQRETQARDDVHHATQQEVQASNRFAPQKDNGTIRAKEEGGQLKSNALSRISRDWRERMLLTNQR